jgi:hypothetical protein
VAKITTDVVVGHDDKLFEAVHFLYDNKNDTVVLRLDGITMFFRDGDQLEMFLHEALQTYFTEAEKLKQLAKA